MTTERQSCDLFYLVYGDFRDQQTGKNFFFIRIPDGAWSDGYTRRIPWSKKIAPAINRLVREIVEDLVWTFWNIDLLDEYLWELNLAGTRQYSWIAESSSFRLEP